MNPINVVGFAGASLAATSTLLNEQVGAYVIDAEPWAGDLRPLRARVTEASVPASPQRRTIYRYEGVWLSWSTLVNVMKTFDGTDTTHRIAYTGDGAPKETNNDYGLTGGPPYPQATRPFGIPAPTNQLVTTLNTDGTGDESTIYYVQTFVTDLGRESAPSPISAGLVMKFGAIVDISNLGAAPAGNYGINRRRIYRTQAGAAEGPASFFFLRELAIGVTTTQDDARTLGDNLLTVGWRPMPDDAFGLLPLWNAFAAVLVDGGKTVGFTELDAAYALPIKYDRSIQDKGVALAKWEQNLLVLTEGAPVIFNGQDPAGMSETPSTLAFSCATAAGVVGFKHGVVWASNEGLAYTGNPLSVITAALLTTEQWKALNPSSIVAGRWGRFYVASYGAGVDRRGFMLDPLRPGDGIWFLSSGFDACWYDELADELFVLEGANVRRFAAGAKQVAMFRSKTFHQALPRSFVWCKVVASSYPCIVRVYADGVLRDTRSVVDSKPFTLRGGFKAEDWQIEVENDDATQAVHLATDIRDLSRLG